MPLYMTQFAYTSEAWTTLTQNPEDRSEAIRGLVETMDDRFISAYNTFGEYDGLVIFEAPDEGTAAATAIAAITPGHQKYLGTRSHSRRPCCSAPKKAWRRCAGRVR